MSNHPLATQVRRHLNNSTDFELPRPTPGKKLFVLCPVSGGIDSTAVAIVMAVLYPTVPVTFVYTSTGIDEDGNPVAAWWCQTTMAVTKGGGKANS